MRCLCFERFLNHKNKYMYKPKDKHDGDLQCESTFAARLNRKEGPIIGQTILSKMQSAVC